MAPRNGVYIVQGEMSLVVSALRRNARWGSHNHQDEEQDPLLHGFSQLKETLASVTDLAEVDVNVFLGPFLDVIRSEDTTGPITGVALSSVNKFLSYGLIEPTSESAASGIENLADAVTHARFVGTDPSSDEVVLMKILQVLRTLLLTPVGAHMTNESVCEIMQSCFRICFETRLSELLRRSAEQTLMDMVQLLFSRLPQFKEESRTGVVTNIRRVLKRAGAIATGKRKKHMSPKSRRANASESPPPAASSTPDPTELSSYSEPPKIANDADEINSSSNDTPSTVDNPPTQEPDPLACITEQTKPPSITSDSSSENSFVKVDEPALAQNSETMESCSTQTDEEPSVASQVMQDIDSVSVEGMVITGDDREGVTDKPVDQESHESVASTIMTDNEEENKQTRERTVSVSVSLDGEDVEEIVESTICQNADPSAPQDDFVNPRGVRFTPQEHVKEGGGPLIPYGLPCVRELFRFLISLTNPHDRHNSEPMIHMGLSLLTVALESGAQSIGTFTSLMSLVKDEMCRNVFMLLQCDFMGLFAMALRVCFLLFESLRGHMKFQMEMFFKKLMDILAQDQQGVHYEKRELILDAINQLFRVPNLVTELYLNYDCDLYCTNVFEELCKLLSKNAFPAGSLYSVHLLALDALLAVVQSVEGHCHSALLSTMNKAMEEAVPSETEQQHRKPKDKAVDSDSGTDESCDLVSSTASPPASGYSMASRMTVGVVSGDSTEKESEQDENEEERVHHLSVGLLFATSLPTADSLAKLKQRKKLLQAGTDQFNTKAKKGIEFLQEHSLLSTPLNPEEIAKFLKENPKLDKKIIADYIGDRRNARVLDAFVNLFHFHDHRIDEGLRVFLESFRLPGESPVIAHIMESFSEVFYEANPDGFANKDAVFTLVYAVIMLNVDQHNANIKQQKPMTLEEFKRNLRKTNGGSDFSASMLEEVYHAIRNEEIVMPSERSGRIKDNYDWKVLLHRSVTPEGKYIHSAGSSFDQDLFMIIWGPTVAALSYVYDNGLEKSVVQKAIMGFRKCALISAHYGLSDVFDNLVISLCKFTTLLTASEVSESLPVAFGSNIKAQLSARTMFALAHRHGDILREGWKNIMDCMLQLFKAKLLPKSMVEAEDFVEASGRISLLREELPSTRPDSSIFSWYQYLVNPEPAVSRGQTAEDKEAREQAQNCIRDCHPELLVTESKFLRYESLNELIKVLTFASNIENQETNGSSYDEEAAVFFLELLIRVVLQNRDRVPLLWQTIRDHLSNIIINANQHCSLVERAVVGLLRLAIRLLRKEEVSSQVLITLRVLLLMKFNVLRACGRQISYGLHELLRTSAASITTARDWTTVFTLLECIGASTTPPVLTPASSLVLASKDVDGDSNGAEFDLSEGTVGTESEAGSYTSTETESGFGGSIPGDSWLLISKEDTEATSVNQFDLTVSAKLNKHDSKCFVKSCQSLTFLIRDGAHVSRENFLQCVHAVRVFAEGILNGGAGYRQDGMQHKEHAKQDKASQGRANKKSKAKKTSPTGVKSRKFVRSTQSSPATSEDEAEIFETINNTYDAMSLQLIELMHALHTRASTFFEKSVQNLEIPEKSSSSCSETVEERETDREISFLWTKCWCPLLQGIAQLCCDNRRDIRMSALTYLQRGLLVHDLQSLTAVEWESCFNKVLFPMLARLLEVSSPSDPIALEETRMRAATLLSKVFLQHLTPLLSLSTFTALWLTILDFMDKYMHADKSDLLFEAIPESLKNMLLVMSTAGIFDEENENTSVSTQVDGQRRHPMSRSDSDVYKYSALWQVTWERIDCFLPNLKQELFSSRSQSSRANSTPVSSSEQQSLEQQPAVPRNEEPITQQAADKVTSRPSSPPPTSRVTPAVTQSVTPVVTPSVMSPPSTQQVCVVLQPPLPSLSNRSSSPAQLGSLADNVRPTSVPIILAPSPSLSTPTKGTPLKASSLETPSAPTDCDIQIETESAVVREDCCNDIPSNDDKEDIDQGAVASSERPKKSVYDI